MARVRTRFEGTPKSNANKTDSESSCNSFDEPPLVLSHLMSIILTVDIWIGGDEIDQLEREFTSAMEHLARMQLAAMSIHLSIDHTDLQTWIYGNGASDFSLR